MYTCSQINAHYHAEGLHFSEVSQLELRQDRDVLYTLYYTRSIAYNDQLRMDEYHQFHNISSIILLLCKKKKCSMFSGNKVHSSRNPMEVEAWKRVYAIFTSGGYYLDNIQCYRSCLLY